MRARVRPHQVLETTVEDLETIVRVTPGTDTKSRRIKEGRVLEVGGI